MCKIVLYSSNHKVKDLYTLPSIIESAGDKVLISRDRNEVNEALDNNPIDLIICDRQSFLLTSDQIKQVKNNCYNIHPSFLPYNRGYHPNFWSAYDNTPSGTTIHNINPNIDSGRIVAQTLIYFDDNETLKTSYLKLRELSVSLFKTVYPSIREGLDQTKLISNPSNIGITNYKSDFEGILETLPNKWETSLGYIRNLSKTVEFKRREKH